jgi:hypothetical protein
MELAQTGRGLREGWSKAKSDPLKFASKPPASSL